MGLAGNGKRVSGKLCAHEFAGSIAASRGWSDGTDFDGTGSNRAREEGEENEGGRDESG